MPCESFGAVSRHLQQNKADIGVIEQGENTLVVHVGCHKREGFEQRQPPCKSRPNRFN
ncbi:MAG: hypothetical protein Q9163_003504 [Psora crenata]